MKRSASLRGIIALVLLLCAGTGAYAQEQSGSIGVPGLSGTAPSGVLSARDAYLLTGYDPAALANSLRAAGTVIRDNPLYGKPSGFQGRRQLRVGIKYTF
jgi:hypothetical protein